MQDIRMLIGGAALIALSGLAAAACPPDGDAGCCETGCDQANGCDKALECGEATEEVSFGVMGGDDGEAVHAVMEWIDEGGALHEIGDDDDEVEIMILKDGDTIKIIRNGEEISADELGDDVKFLHLSDDHGAGMHLGMIPAVSANGNIQMQAHLVGDDDNQLVETVVRQSPPVMMGITMGEPQEALRAHLGLGDREVIMIDKIFDGLPASDAGLRQFDIIVGIDGSGDNVNAEHLHEVLMGKHPGDTLKLHVIRGGEKETYAVKLRAYNAQKLGMEMEDEDITLPGAHDGQFFFDQSTGHAGNPDQIEEMLEKLQESGIKGEQLAQIRRELAQVMREGVSQGQPRRFVEDHGSMSPMQSARPNAPQRLTTRVVPAPDGQQMFQIEVPGAENMQIPEGLRGRIQGLRGLSSQMAPDDVNERLDDLEARLDDVTEELEDRLDRMIDRFENLADLIERRLGDGG